jgi:HAD superfamily hydrolase (TIGR01490 family)
MIRAAAFFDLDGTLIAVNSGRLWLSHERAHRRLSVQDAAKGLAYLAAYKLGIVDVREALELAASALRDRLETEFDDGIREWYTRVVSPLRAPLAARAIERHRAAGHRLVLLTTSTSYQAAIAAVDFGLDHHLGTRFVVRDGRFTGALEHPVPFGRGKVALAEAYAEREGISLEHSYFYSDSVTDLPMLERVGHPRIVNPDPRLALIARRRSIPVLDWGEPVGPYDRTLRQKVTSLFR